MEDAGQESSWLLSRESLTRLERALFGAFALIPLTAIWDLVIQPWPAMLSAFGLLVLPIVLGAAAISAILAAAAILAPQREIRVDPEARAVLDSGRARWLGRWGYRIPFDDIQEVTLRKDYDSEGADNLQLALVLRSRKLPLVLLTRPATRRTELESLAARLRAAVQP